jgi:hypothetical protein
LNTIPPVSIDPDRLWSDALFNIHSSQTPSLSDYTVREFESNTPPFGGYKLHIVAAYLRVIVVLETNDPGEKMGKWSSPVRIPYQEALSGIGWARKYRGVLRSAIICVKELIYALAFLCLREHNC